MSRFQRMKTWLSTLIWRLTWGPHGCVVWIIEECETAFTSCFVREGYENNTTDCRISLSKQSMIIQTRYSKTSTMAFIANLATVEYLCHNERPHQFLEHISDDRNFRALMRSEEVGVVAGGHVGIFRIRNSPAALGRLRGNVLDNGVDCADDHPVLSVHERPEGRALALSKTSKRCHHSHQHINVVVALTVFRVLAATKWLSECRQPASSLLETNGTLKSVLSVNCLRRSGARGGQRLVVVSRNFFKGAQCGETYLSCAVASKRCDV